MNDYNFDGHEVIAEVQTASLTFPWAVLCKVTDPTALNAENEPWVVWPVAADGARGSGYYSGTFEMVWAHLGQLAKH